MNRCTLLFMVAAVFAASACAKPLAEGKIIPEVRYLSGDFAANPNDVYYSVRWGMDQHGYALDQEDMEKGLVVTAWRPVTSDSHYVSLFNRPDYVVTNSYHQLEIHVVPEGGRTRVRVGSRIKSLLSNLKSSGIEEKKILDAVGNYLRTGEPEITNLGVTQ